jgi:hypothetical protein
MTDQTLAPLDDLLRAVAVALLPHITEALALPSNRFLDVDDFNEYFVDAMNRHDVMTSDDFDADDYEILTRDNFSPQDFDCITDSDGYVTLEEAIEGVQDWLGRINWGSA